MFMPDILFPRVILQMVGDLGDLGDTVDLTAFFWSPTSVRGW